MPKTASYPIAMFTGALLLLAGMVTLKLNSELKKAARRFVHLAFLTLISIKERIYLRPEIRCRVKVKRMDEEGADSVARVSRAPVCIEEAEKRNFLGFT